MPILDVEIVLKPGEGLRDGLAADIARRAALLFGAPPGRTWVRLRGLPWEQYAEDSEPAGGAHPVFVRVLHRQRPAATVLRQEAATLAKAIAAVCDRPAENVHLFYEPDAVGRVAFGGEVVT